MIVPNKVINFSNSVIGKMIFILEQVSLRDMTIEELYLNTYERFEEIDEFIYSLDVLYVLDAIVVDLKKGVVSYVNRN
jgi:hypothetical protein